MTLVILPETGVESYVPGVRRWSKNYVPQRATIRLPKELELFDISSFSKMTLISVPHTDVSFNPKLKYN